MQDHQFDLVVVRFDAGIVEAEDYGIDDAPPGHNAKIRVSQK